MTTSETENKSHFRGSILLFGGRIFALVVNFAVQVITIRYLSKADFGILAFAVSVTGMFSVFCLIGLDKSISRYLTVYFEANDYQKFWGTVVLSFGSVSFIGLCVVTAIVTAFQFERDVFGIQPKTLHVLAIVSGLIVAETLNSLFVSFFAVLSEARSIFFRRHVLGPTLKLIAVVIVALNGGSVFQFAAGQLLAVVIATLTCFPMLWSAISKHSKLIWPGVANLRLPLNDFFVHGLGLLIGDLGFLLRGALVPIIIGLNFPADEVASYQSAFTIARLNEFVLLTFSILFLPKAAKLSHDSDSRRLQSLVETTSVWIILLSLPLFSLTFLAGNSLPRLIFGEEYQSSGLILQWLALGFFINASFGINLRLMRTVGKLRFVILGDVLIILFSLLAIWLLIPQFGPIGAAYAVLASYIFQNVVYQYLAAKHTHIKPLSLPILTPFIAVLLLVFAARIAQSSFQIPDVFGPLLAGLVTLVVIGVFFQRLGVPEFFPELRNLPLIGKKTKSVKR